MPDDPASRCQHAADAIERYLALHPSAADSVQGVAQWWLPSIGVDLPQAAVEQALEHLVSEGRMVRECTASSQPIYRAQRDTGA